MYYRRGRRARKLFGSRCCSASREDFLLARQSPSSFPCFGLAWLACFGLLVELLPSFAALEMADSQEFDPGGAEDLATASVVGTARVEERPVVTGGRLKSPWAPTLCGTETGGPAIMVQGSYFIALSGNDYGLGLFLFGKANGEGGRNLAKVGIIRALWKARIAAQDAALAELSQAEEAHRRSSDGGDVLSALWDNMAYNGGEAGEADARPKKKSKSAPKKKSQLSKLPPTIAVTVPSSQPGVASVTFVLLRADDARLPSIELKGEVLETLFKECQAEYPGEVSEGSNLHAAPATPPVATRKRRTSPLVRSPSSTSPRSGRKRRPASTHYDKRNQRIVCRWVDSAGKTRTRGFHLQNAGDSKEVDKIRKQALGFAKARQGEPAE